MCFYGAESKEAPWSSGLSGSVMVQEIVGKRGWASPCDNLTVNPAVNGYFFRIREG